MSEPDPPHSAAEVRARVAAALQRSPGAELGASVAADGTLRRLGVSGVCTVSEANTHSVWQARWRRSKAQREIIFYALHPYRPPPLPLRVVLSRLAPRSHLDTDNLAGALKAVRDEVARWLGVDDGSPAVRWECEQRDWPVQGVQIALFREPDR